MEAATPKNLFFARFFNPYDATGHHYSGFYQNLNLDEEYPALEVLQEIAAFNINSYLYSEYSQRYVTDYWASFMSWDKEHKRYNIDPTFYECFGSALCAQLQIAENLFQLTQIDWDNLLDEITTTKVYGDHVKTRERGNDTTTTGARRDTQHLDYAQQHSVTTTDLGERKTIVTDDIAKRKKVDTNAYGKQESDLTTENDKAAFNPDPTATYSADTKSRTHGENIKARTDTLTSIEDASKDEHTTDSNAVRDTEHVTSDAHHDTVTNDTGEQTITDTYGNITDRDNTHTDTITVEGGKAYDHEKLLKIKEELASINAYKVVGDAIAAVMLRKDWGWC